MDREGVKGSITVFLSISCILFLSLICAAVESARIQGARTQAANIVGMGNLSLMSEFEKNLLEKYEIFSLDGAYGSGNFQIQNVNEKLKGYLQANADPGADFLESLCSDPWKLQLSESEVVKYALLTDDDGEPFYQQAVSFMKQSVGAMVISQILEASEDADLLEKYQEEYENSEKKNENQMQSLEGQKEQKLEELQAAEQGGNDIIVLEDGTSEIVIGGDISQGNTGMGNEGTAGPPAEVENPLEEISKLRKKSILDIVTWDKQVSEKKIRLSSLPSKGRSRKGTLNLEYKHDGIVADTLFREYLLNYFTDYRDEGEEKGLEYQVEYLLGGKSSDEANLKYVVTRLLLLREGMNYLYCAQHSQMNGQAGNLATALTGFLGIPALTEATKHAILLAWAYGESLIDVRSLLDGGKVPVYKTNGSWQLSLDNLGRLTELLQQGAPENGEGLEYEDYLRILLNLGSVKKQKLRALDMIQIELQGEKDTQNFKAENGITAVYTSTKWNCRPVFLRLPMAIMGTKEADMLFVQEGSIAY